MPGVAKAVAKKKPKSRSSYKNVCITFSFLSLAFCTVGKKKKRVPPPLEKGKTTRRVRSPLGIVGCRSGQAKQPDSWPKVILSCVLSTHLVPRLQRLWVLRKSASQTYAADPAKEPDRKRKGGRLFFAIVTAAFFFRKTERPTRRVPTAKRDGSAVVETGKRKRGGFRGTEGKKKRREKDRVRSSDGDVARRVRRAPRKTDTAWRGVARCQCRHTPARRSRSGAA